MKRLLLFCLLLIAPAFSEERTLTPEQMEQLANEGELPDETPERPANLPDLTKYDPLPKSGKGKDAGSAERRAKIEKLKRTTRCASCGQIK